MVHVFFWCCLLLYLALAMLVAIGTGIGYFPPVSGGVATVVLLCLAGAAAWLADRA